MTQRSPFNDRYKVDQKGKTRKSASAAKPKRAVAEVGTGTKKSGGRSSAWSRAKASSAARQKQSTKSTPAELPPSPRLKALRRQWWIAWIGAMVIAVAILGLQTLGNNAGVVAETAAKASSTATTATVAAAKAAATDTYTRYVPIGWILWLLAMGYALYVEFIPIRKERAAMIEEARAAKSHRPERTGRGPKAPVIPDASDRTEDEDGTDE